MTGPIAAPLIESIARYGSGGPYEESIGYSRLVVAGGFAFTAGCTAIVDGVLQHRDDAFGQTAVAIANALAALQRAGIAPASVVQSRIYLTDREHVDAVGRAHGAAFGQIRPAATMVLVAGLIDAEMLVEIELVALAP
jgi:enamine deaminase RidA (YjgF/YER057c/UK114 family)